jgi:hypothetical protein
LLLLSLLLLFASRVFVKSLDQLLRATIGRENGGEGGPSPASISHATVGMGRDEDSSMLRSLDEDELSDMAAAAKDGDGGGRRVEMEMGSQLLLRAGRQLNFLLDFGGPNPMTLSKSRCVTSDYADIKITLFLVLDNLAPVCKICGVRKICGVSVKFTDVVFIPT